MGRLFGGDDTDDAPSEDRKEPDYNDSDFQKRDLYKKGLNHMSNEKFLDAIRSFDLALRLDSQYVDAWIKRGYAHFHLGEYTVADLMTEHLRLTSTMPRHGTSRALPTTR